MDQTRLNVLDFVNTTIEYMEKYNTMSFNGYSYACSNLKNLTETLFVCEECKFGFASQQAVQGHHCEIKDAFKSGSYHWFKYDVLTRRLKSIRLGYSKNILENLKFLILPALYVICQDPHEKCKDESFVKKIESAFGEQNDGFIYMNFIEMGTDHDRKISSVESKTKSWRAFQICLRDCLDKSLLTNESPVDEKCLQSSDCQSYEYYMKKTADDLAKENFLKFSKEQFNMLTSIIKQDSNFINNLNAFKNSKNGRSKHEILSFLDKNYLIKNRSNYKALVSILEDVKKCNKLDFKYMPTLFWRY